MKGSVLVALNSPSNLKLGVLGHIAGGNANTTSATSLGGTCRGSTGTETSMWDDFKVGTVSVASTYVSGSTGSDKTQFGITFKGDVGEYMGATGGSQTVLEGELITGIDPNGHERIVEASETGTGSLYSRIQDRLANRPDYEGYYNTTHGTAAFMYQHDYQASDKLDVQAV